MKPAKLPREDVALLLRDLCIELGFCLSPQDQNALCDSPPSDVDGFTDAVFQAEGLDASPHTGLYGQVRKMVAEAFGDDRVATLRQVSQSNMLDRTGDLPGRWVRIVDEPERRRLEDELTRECGSAEHPLYGVEAQAVARCGVCDDVLYGLPGNGRWAVVHLTWARSPETDPHWPCCDLLDDWPAVTNELLDRGH